MSLPIGDGGYLQHRLEDGGLSILAMGARAQDRVAYHKQRCRELGLAHDEHGFPRLRTDAELLAQAKTPEHRARLVRKFANRKAAAIRRDREQCNARIDAFAARMVATASEAARTDPSMAMLNRAQRRPAAPPRAIDGEHFADAERTVHRRDTEHTLRHRLLTCGSSQPQPDG
jgi:hypothetical protein